MSGFRGDEFATAGRSDCPIWSALVTSSTTQAPKNQASRARRSPTAFSSPTIRADILLTPAPEASDKNRLPKAVALTA